MRTTPGGVGRGWSLSCGVLVLEGVCVCSREAHSALFTVSSMKAEGNLLGRRRLCSRKQGCAPCLHALPQTAASGSPFPSHDAPTCPRGRRAPCGCQQPPLPVPPSAGGCEVSHPRDSRCRRMPGSGPSLLVGATILAGRQRPCVPSVSVEPGWMGASRGLPSVLATTRCGRCPLFCGTDGAPGRPGASALPSPGARRLLSTPPPTCHLNPCDRRGHSAASGESGAAQALQALGCSPWKVPGPGKDARDLAFGALGGPGGVGRHVPIFSWGNGRGWRLPGVSVGHEPSP